MGSTIVELKWLDQDCRGKKAKIFSLQSRLTEEKSLCVLVAGWETRWRKTLISEYFKRDWDRSFTFM
jgi:hypothetical protein